MPPLTSLEPVLCVGIAEVKASSRGTAICMQETKPGEHQKLCVFYVQQTVVVVSFIKEEVSQGRRACIGNAR